MTVLCCSYEDKNSFCFFFCRHEREQTKVPGRVQGREKSNLFMARAICERGEDGLQGRELRNHGERSRSRAEQRETIARIAVLTEE